MLYQLALLAGLDVVERHRHGRDLFPDAGRTVPFGCGATVFYNMADLRFDNPHAGAVMLRLHVTRDELVGAVVAGFEPAHDIEVYESEHAFTQRLDGTWERRNRIARRWLTDRQVVRDEEVAVNHAGVSYTPSDLTTPRLTLTPDPVSWSGGNDRLA
jgi:vancomycin resistance protein VanW